MHARRLYAVGAWFMLIASLCACTRATPVGVQEQKTPKQEEKKSEATPEFKMTAAELAADWVKDEKAAEAKYKDKVIEVTGEVQHVGPTLDQIMLKGVKKDPKDALAFDIRLGIPVEQWAQCARFSNGQKIKAVGKYFSKTSKYYITITDCKVTELEKSKTVIISAEDLAREFEKDAEAAEKKYKGPDNVVITGVVESLRKEKDDSVYAVLKGTGKTRVATQVGFLFMTKVEKGHMIEARVLMDFPEFRDNELRLITKLVISTK
jgi:hypothetical protein